MDMASRKVSTFGPRSAKLAGALAARKASASSGAAGWPAFSFSWSGTGAESGRECNDGLAAAGAATTGAGAGEAATGAGAAGAAGTGTMGAGGALGAGFGNAGAAASTAAGAAEGETGPSSSKSAVVRGNRLLNSDTRRCRGWCAL